jgi:outer membrane receptor for ferrienterochelin and colicins
MDLGILIAIQWMTSQPTTVAPRPAATSSTGIDGAMERVVITGSRRAERLADTVTLTEVIPRSEIEASGAEDLAEILEGHPGVQIVRSFAGAGIRLQGLDPEKTLILVDGQRLNGRIDGTLDLSRITAERIERVEIIKGAASSLYGSDALGGVVNIVTRDADVGTSASVRATQGLLQSTNGFDLDGPTTTDVTAYVSQRGETYTVSLTGGFHRQSAFDLSPQDVGTSGSQLDSGTIEGMFELRPSERFRVSLRADYHRRALAGVDVGPELPDATDNPFRSADQTAVFDRRNDTQTVSATLKPVFQLTDRQRLTLSAHFSRFRDDFEYDQRGQDAQDRFQNTVDDTIQTIAQHDWQVSDRVVVVSGMEGLVERLSTQRIEGGQQSRFRWSGFGQLTLQPVDDLRLVPGVRTDLDTQFGDYTAPKISARWDPHPDVVTRASVGYGFRAPSFRDQFLTFENPAAGYVVVGNPDLQPEESRSISASVEVRGPQRTRLRFEYYRNDVTNLIAFLPGSDPAPGQPQRFTNDNIDQAVTTGAEVTADWRFRPWLQLEFAYTFLRARDRTSDRPLDGRAPHRFTARWLARHRPWGLQAWVRATAVSSRPFFVGEDESERVDAPAYATVDVRVEQRLSRWASVFVGGDNLANAGDPQFLPLQPRGFYAGASGRY